MSQQSSANQGQCVVTNILDFDLQRKHKLVEIYDEILQVADEFKHEINIIRELKTQFGKFKKEIPHSKEILLEEECPILIAGETSAGKSAFINLLIGNDILPVSALESTSTIIKIHNSTKKEIRVTDENDKTKLIKFDPDENSSLIQKEVKKYVTFTGEVLNCKCVDIYFPVPMLKGNTVIEDTPGIGTTAFPELTARLFEFLPRAVSLICIIDASHAGGVVQDRLLAIFEEIRKQRQNGKLIEFDVSRTIFVCNKWDMIEEEEQEDVWNYILQKLREHWPNFNEKQVVKLSVKEEKKLAKQDKSSEMYAKLLSGIRKMVRSSLEANIVMNARWQKKFLTAMIDRTFGRIKLSRKCESERKELIHTAEEGQHVLLSKTVEVEERVIVNAKVKCVELSKKATNTVRRMLNQPKESDEIDEFNLKPFKFLSEWYDEMLLRRFSEKEMYCRLKSEYIKPFKQKMKHVFRSIIQQQIKADNVFIMNLTNDIRSYKEIRKVYLPFGEKAKVMMGKLLLVAMEYFSKDTIATVNSRNYSQEQKWKGRFAQVGTIEMLHGQKWVKAVVKTMKRPLNNDISLIQLTEVDSLRNINHTNIVQIYGTSIETGDNGNKHLKVYMEQCTESLENMVFQNRSFMSCGKLQDWNRDESKQSKRIYATIMSGVLAGLAHLHEEGFVHRDLKMSNILVIDEIAKLADAGLIELNGHTCIEGGSYFPTTVAPEVFTDENCDDTESDIYSIGILMWELYYCRPAFTSLCIGDVASKSVQKEEYEFEVKDARELIDQVLGGYRPTFETYRPVPKLMELMTKCWSADMSKRPTAKIAAIELGKAIKS